MGGGSRIEADADETKNRWVPGARASTIRRSERQSGGSYREVRFSNGTSIRLPSGSLSSNAMQVCGPGNWNAVGGELVMMEGSTRVSFFARDPCPTRAFCPALPLMRVCVGRWPCSSSTHVRRPAILAGSLNLPPPSVERSLRSPSPFTLPRRCSRELCLLITAAPWGFHH